MMDCVRRWQSLSSLGVHNTYQCQYQEQIRPAELPGHCPLSEPNENRENSKGGAGNCDAKPKGMADLGRIVKNRYHAGWGIESRAVRIRIGCYAPNVLARHGKVRASVLMMEGGLQWEC